jgi:hypothetical protein
MVVAAAILLAGGIGAATPSSTPTPAASYTFHTIGG